MSNIFKSERTCGARELRNRVVSAEAQTRTSGEKLPRSYEL